MKSNRLAGVRRVFWLLNLVVLVFAQELRAEDFDAAATQAAAAKGEAKAQYELAWRYAKGRGLPQDLAQGVRYMRQAAEQGYALAETDLGADYAQGSGVKQDFPEAVKWFQKAAAQGDALGQYCLGNCHIFGRGVDKDVAEGIKWWRAAAENGRPEAQTALGDFYMCRGPYVDTNYVSYVEAFKWLRLAGDQKYVPALNNLGYLYQYGLGQAGKRDYAAAQACYLQAAAAGDPKAESNLGIMYQEGMGVKRDLVAAYKWFILGADQREPAARHCIADLEKTGLLSPDQIAQARQMADDFRAALPQNGALPPTNSVPKP
jgi:TPR repeat protein